MLSASYEKVSLSGIITGIQYRVCTLSCASWDHFQNHCDPGLDKCLRKIDVNKLGETHTLLII